MALLDPTRLQEQLAGIASLPVARQVAVLVGIAASVALAVQIVIWAQGTDYGLLFGNVDDGAAGEILQRLDEIGIPYDIDERSGSIRVPRGRLHEARLKLADAGLPRERSSGYELLQSGGSFGSSNRMEAARLQHALELELSHSIESLEGVASARVHLGLPAPTTFMRASGTPSASVVLTLASTNAVNGRQVHAVAHLVAAAVPGLEATNVEVIDQRGQSVAARDELSSSQASMTQLDYRQRVEENLSRRIEQLLTPIVGVGRVRAEVAAEIDFSLVERTLEDYNPDPQAIRSEQTNIEEPASEEAGNASGAPGVLANQPPPAADFGSPGSANETQRSTTRRQENTRNYELDRVVETVKQPVGRIDRLSVAVVIDDLVGTNEAGEAIRETMSPERIAELTALVEGAIGFDVARGDRVQVMSSPFRFEAPVSATPTPLWEQESVWRLGRELAAALGVLILIFGVLRPFMRSMAEAARTANAMAELPAPALAAEGGNLVDETALVEDRLTLSENGTGNQKPMLINYEERVAHAKDLVSQDPRIAARVVKDWVGPDG